MCILPSAGSAVLQLPEASLQLHCMTMTTKTDCLHADGFFLPILSNDKAHA